MNKIISSNILKAYTQCELQAYFLIFKDILHTESDYSNAIRENKEITKNKYLEKLKKESEIQEYSLENMKQKIDILYDANIAIGIFTTSIDVVKINSFKDYSPIVVLGTKKVTKEDKVELAFNGYILSKFQEKNPLQGTMVSSDLKSHTVKLEPLYKDISKIIKKINSWIKNQEYNKPPLILNKNCSFCIFQKKCKADALEQDSLSLLDRMTGTVTNSVSIG